MSEDLKKPARDDRSYRMVWLKNGMQVGVVVSGHIASLCRVDRLDRTAGDDRSYGMVWLKNGMEGILGFGQHHEVGDFFLNGRALMASLR